MKGEIFMAKQKTQKSERLPTLQIVVTAEFKRDVEDLARSCGRQVSDLLLPIVAQFVSLNRARIEKYREMIEIPALSPFGQAAQIAADDDAPDNVDAEKGGGDNAEN